MKKGDTLFGGGNPLGYTYEELRGEDWRDVMNGLTIEAQLDALVGDKVGVIITRGKSLVTVEGKLRKDTSTDNSSGSIWSVGAGDVINTWACAVFDKKDIVTINDRTIKIDWR